MGGEEEGDGGWMRSHSTVTNTYFNTPGATYAHVVSDMLDTPSGLLHTL